MSETEKAVKVTLELPSHVHGELEAWARSELHMSLVEMLEILCGELAQNPEGRDELHYDLREHDLQGKQEAEEALRRLQEEHAKGNVVENFRRLTSDEQRILEAGIRPDSSASSQEQTRLLMRKLQAEHERRDEAD